MVPWRKIQHPEKPLLRSRGFSFTSSATTNHCRCGLQSSLATEEQSDPSCRIPRWSDLCSHRLRKHRSKKARTPVRLNRRCSRPRGWPSALPRWRRVRRLCRPPFPSCDFTTRWPLKAACPPIRSIFQSQEVVPYPLLGFGGIFASETTSMEARARRVTAMETGPFPISTRSNWTVIEAGFPPQTRTTWPKTFAFRFIF